MTPPRLALLVAALCAASPSRGAAGSSGSHEAAWASARGRFEGMLEGNPPEEGTAEPPSARPVAVSPESPETVEYRAVPEESSVRFEARTRLGDAAGTLSRFTLVARVTGEDFEMARISGTVDLGSVELPNRSILSDLIRRFLKDHADSTGSLETDRVIRTGEDAYLLDILFACGEERHWELVEVKVERVGADLRLKGSVTEEFGDGERAGIRFDILMRKT